MLSFGAESLPSRLLSKNLNIEIYKITILPVVLYGCEILSLTVKKGRRLKVFENRVLRRIFAPKRDEVTKEWRKLHNEELNDLYTSPKIVRVIKLRRMKWPGHVTCMGKRRGVCRILVGKPEGKGPLERLRCRLEDNNKTDLQEMGFGVWIESSWHKTGTGGGHLLIR